MDFLRKKAFLDEQTVSHPKFWPFSCFLLSLGIWLLFSSATFGYSAEKKLFYSEVSCGLLLILFALFSEKLLSFVSLAVALYLQVAPLLFWAKSPAAYLNQTVVSLLLFFLLTLLTQKEKEAPSAFLPPKWTYNPSSYTQRTALLIFALLAWMLARYLAAYQLGYAPILHDPLSSVSTIQILSSPIAKLFPVADAGLGAFGYTLEFFLILHGSSTRFYSTPWIVLFFGLVTIPLSITSLLLILLQPLVLKAWCGLCIVIAICMLFILALSLDEIVATKEFLFGLPKKERWKTLWKGKKPEIEEKREEALYPLIHTFFQGFRGICFAPNLILTLFLGMWIAAKHIPFPSQHWIHSVYPLIGIITAVISFLSMAWHARAWRFALLLSSFLLIFLSLYNLTFPSFSLFSLVIGIAVGILSLFYPQKDPTQT